MSCLFVRMIMKRNHTSAAAVTWVMNHNYDKYASLHDYKNGWNSRQVKRMNRSDNTFIRNVHTREKNIKNFNSRTYGLHTEIRVGTSHDQINRTRLHIPTLGYCSQYSTTAEYRNTSLYGIIKLWWGALRWRSCAFCQNTLIQAKWLPQSKWVPKISKRTHFPYNAQLSRYT